MTEITVHGETITLPVTVELDDGTEAELVHTSEFKQLFRCVSVPDAPGGVGYMALPTIIFRGRRSTLVNDHPTVQ